MKRILFLVMSTVLGAATALGVISILGAIAIPVFSSWPLTQVEIQGFKLMAEKFDPVIRSPQIVTVLLSIMAAVVVALLLMVLNPALGLKTIRNRTSVLKAISVIVLTVVLGLLMRLSADIKMTLFFILAAVMFFGLLWAVAGREGWAGDFTSWQSGADLSGLAKSFALGSATGLIIALLVKFNAWAFFDRYFILVSEVLDGSGDTSYLGMVYLFKGMLFLFTLSFGVAAGVIIAMAPVRLKMTERARWAAVPVVLALVLFGVSMSMYRDAVVHYDLGAPDLNAAAGLSEELPPARTLVVFRSEDDKTPSVQEKHRIINAGSFVGTSEIAATGENLRLIEQFMQDRSEGSVYLYTAMDGRNKLLFSLWRPDEARQAMQKSATELMLPRLLIVRHLQKGQVTESNKELLRWITTDGPFVLKGGSMERFGLAAVHQGELDMAREFKARADAEEIDTGEFIIPDEPPVTDGIISGNINLEGTSLPEGTLIGLFALYECGADIHELNEATAESWMVDTVSVGSDGAFSFDHLGEGGYYLVLNADASTIPSDNKRVSVSNGPGELCINGDTPSIDVGKVVIKVRQ